MVKRKVGDPERQAKLQKVYDTLKRVRSSTTVTLKRSPLMRETFKDLEGNEQPFRLRYYQVQGAYHLLALKRMVLGDDTGLGKTVEAIVAACHMFDRDPLATKVIVITPKSTVHQWGSEIQRFTEGIKPYVVETKVTKDGSSPLDQRKAIYQRWLNHKGPSVLIINYALLVRDWNAEGVQPVDEEGKPDPKQPVVPGVLDQLMKDAAEGERKLVVFADEAQAFKNTKTKTWEICRQISDRADRVYGLTATLLKSNLMEGFSIYKAIKPELFKNKTAFMRDYCITTLQSIPGSRRKIPIVKAYKNIDHFRETIDPFFYGRFKKDVSDELPVLVAKDIVCELSAAENKKYSEAIQGIIELGDGEIKDFEEHKALVALIYCQQVVDSMSLLKFEEGQVVDEGFDLATLTPRDIKVGSLGTKEQALIDLLQGELEDEKVIVYTRFASLVPRLQKILEREKIRSVRITGKDSDKKRKEAQTLFQDKDSGVQVIFITDAGGVGINLQMSRALVYYDLPWTWGDYVQILGRMIRIGSPHKGVMAYHLLAERPHDTGSRKTIDHHVLALLRKKKVLIDRVLGEGVEGALEFDTDTSLKSLMQAIMGDDK